MSHEQDEPDLTNFENALDDSLIDSLPSDPKNPPKTELGVIRDVIEQLSAELGIEFQLHTPRELHHRLALNFRLDDLIYTSPQKMSDELATAIQENKINDKKSEDIFISLTQGDNTELKSEEELETQLFHVYQVLEVVIADPQRLFETNIESQGLLLFSLQRSADVIQQRIVELPAFNAEIIDSKTYLTKHLKRLEENYDKWEKEFPEVYVHLNSFLNGVKELVSKVPENISEPRGYLTRIVRLIGECSQVSLGSMEYSLNEQNYADVVDMINELI